MMSSIEQAGAQCFAQVTERWATQRDTLLLASVYDNDRFRCLHYAVPKDLLLSLHFLYGKPFEKALQVYEACEVVVYVGQHSGRRAFQVQSQHKGAARHLVFPTHYCSCHSFNHSVVFRAEAAACKHQLAARLAEATQRARVVVVPDLALANLLMDCMATS